MKEIEFESFIKQEGKKIYNYLLKILRNREDAEDITQEAFLAFYRKMDKVKESSYRSYLFTTAYHKALNHIKQRKDPVLLENTEYLQETGSTQENPDNELVKAALSKLTTEEATLIELQFYQKMSYKQIAEIMGTTASAVDSRLVRAKKKLRKIINKLKKLQESEQKTVQINRGEK